MQPDISYLCPICGIQHIDERFAAECCLEVSYHCPKCDTELASAQAAIECCGGVLVPVYICVMCGKKHETEIIAEHCHPNVERISHD